MIKRQVHYCEDIIRSQCLWSPAGRLLYLGKFYVPAHGPPRIYLIQMQHTVPAVGHPGRSKTLEPFSRNYYWPKMLQDVEMFVRYCHTCQQFKTSRHVPYASEYWMSIHDGLETASRDDGPETARPEMTAA